ncbi:hypothetical protein JG687_00017557 [Phytophthora cactorum]|uniref:Uncharacterized protein n=1 Tax=Phytophthora cactorum TaxID=29920 RepID=A0A8T1TPN6_9STRA|nr:hypothetical protein JG687_00017557 [Phytophthora cactorum]
MKFSPLESKKTFLSQRSVPSSDSTTEAEQDQYLAAQIAALVSKDRQEKATELTDANKRLVKMSLWVEAREVISTIKQSVGIEILDDVMSAVIDGKPQEALHALSGPILILPLPSRHANIRQLQIDVDQSIRDDKYVIPTTLPLRPSESKLKDFTPLKNRDGTYSALALDAQVEEEEEESPSESDSTADLSEEKPPPPAVKPTSSSQPSSSDDSDGDQFASIKNIPPGSSKTKKTASPTSKSMKTPPPTLKTK